MKNHYEHICILLHKLIYDDCFQQFFSSFLQFFFIFTQFMLCLFCTCEKFKDKRAKRVIINDESDT